MVLLKILTKNLSSADLVELQDLIEVDAKPRKICRKEDFTEYSWESFIHPKEDDEIEDDEIDEEETDEEETDEEETDEDDLPF